MIPSRNGFKALAALTSFSLFTIALFLMASQDGFAEGSMGMGMGMMGDMMGGEPPPPPTQAETLASSLTTAVRTNDSSIVESFLAAHPEADPMLSPGSVGGFELEPPAEAALQNYTMWFSHSQSSGPSEDKFTEIALERSEKILTLLSKQGADLKNVQDQIEIKTKKNLDSYYATVKDSEALNRRAEFESDQEKLNQKISDFLNTLPPPPQNKTQSAPPSVYPQTADLSLGELPDSCSLTLFAPSLKEFHDQILQGHLRKNPTGEIRQDFIKQLNETCSLSLTLKTHLLQRKGKTPQIQVVILKKQVSEVPIKKLEDAAILQKLQAEPYARKASEAK